jgi:hypothetical protein
MVWKETKKCKVLFDFLLQYSKMDNIMQSEESNDTFKHFFYLLLEANNWIKMESDKNPDMFDVKMQEIKSASQIPLTITESSTFINNEIIQHINKHSIFMSVYTLNVLDKRIVVYFVFEEAELSKKYKEPNLNVIQSYVKNILLWLYIVNKYSNKQCSPTLNIFIYLTSLEKKVPDTKGDVFSPNHVNTGFTQSCPTDTNEIIIYRHEEWFKVLIHELIHAFGLDFNTSGDVDIRKIFNIPSDIPIYLFEAYTEFWARLLNVMIVSFHWCDLNITEFMESVIFLLDYERVYSIFHMVKILKHMGKTYNNLYYDPTLLTDYKENTNVFAYNIITPILLNNYPLFIRWCKIHNSNILQFNDTPEKVKLLCDYIQNQHNSPQMLIGVNHGNILYDKLQRYTNNKISIRSLSSKKAKSNNKWKFILNTMRMSLCEFENV